MGFDPASILTKETALFIVGFMAIKMFKKWMTATFVAPEPVVDPNAGPTTMSRVWDRIAAADAALVEFLKVRPMCDLPLCQRHICSPACYLNRDISLLRYLTSGWDGTAARPSRAEERLKGPLSLTTAR